MSSNKVSSVLALSAAAAASSMNIGPFFNMNGPRFKPFNWQKAKSKKAKNKIKISKQSKKRNRK